MVGLLDSIDIAVEGLKAAGFAIAEGWTPHDVAKAHSIIQSVLMRLGETGRDG